MLRKEIIKFNTCNGKEVTIDVDDIVDIIIEKDIWGTKHTIVTTKNEKYYTNEEEFKIETVLRPTETKLESIWF